MSTDTTTNVDPDPFDALLNLEDSYYNTGYKDGLQDGLTSGRLEGRIFGLEKGFEKYLTLGKLRGRTLIWEARQLDDVASEYKITNARHIKHIEVLHTLTDNPPIRNEEDDVEEVDDRIRRGKAKAKILAMSLGEAGLEEQEEGSKTNREGEIEDMKMVK